MAKAKLLWSGRSQVVLMPNAFRFKGDEVRIRRHGAAVILEPIPTDWVWLDELSGSVEVDFIQAAAEQPNIAPLTDIDQLFGGL